MEYMKGAEDNVFLLNLFKNPNSDQGSRHVFINL